MNRIKCKVASCKYNDDGEVCQADEIEVKDDLGGTDMMEFGYLEGDAAAARTSKETFCETFAPRKNDKA